MGFTQDETTQIKEYADAVKKHSDGVELKSQTIPLRDDNKIVYGTAQTTPDKKGIEEQKRVYKKELLFLLNRDFRPILRLFERKMPGRVQTLKEILQEIRSEMEGLDWVYVDKEKNLIVCPHAPGDSIDKFVEELMSEVKDAEAQLTTEKPAETEQQKQADAEKTVIEVLGNYESENGNKKGMPLAELEQETERSWIELLSVLNSLGKKQLIEIHKGEGYVPYWLPVELDESPQLRGINANVWRFRLTSAGYELLKRETAQKPAETEYEFSLPPLLPRSGYGIEDPDLCHTANLLALAIAIVVYVEEEKTTEGDKKKLLNLFEKECEKAKLYLKKSANFQARHVQGVPPDSGNARFENPYPRIVQGWLKNSLSGTPDWGKLYNHIELQLVMFKQGYTDWWNKVKSICRRAETTVGSFDVVSEIRKTSEEFGAKKPAETKQNVKRIIAAILISLILILLFELFVYFGPVTWFRNHPHTYRIQGSIICLIPCLILGFFKPRWRKWCWGTAAIAFLVGLLTSL